MTILCYHTVQPGWDSSLAVDPKVFTTHCAWLDRARCVLPLDEAVARLDRTGRLPRGMTALTFDDGLASLHEHALPALALHRLPATVFLVAATLVDPPQPVDWVDDPPPPEGLTTLTIDQVLEMREAGVSFASHSHAHRDLTALDDAEILRDLSESKTVLEDLLGEPVRFLAYPRGRHDARVRQAAERAGYAFAFTLPETAERPGPHAVPRAGVYPHDRLHSLAVKTSRAYVPFRQSRAFPLVRRAVRRISERQAT